VSGEEIAALGCYPNGNASLTTTRTRQLTRLYALEPLFPVIALRERMVALVYCF
jgi:hypothetical protein